jgi:hypothetical protein
MRFSDRSHSAESGPLGLLPSMPVRLEDFHYRWSREPDQDSVGGAR